MTKEDILAMEAGRELDALVAKDIFGIEVEWDYSSWDINKQCPKQPYRKGEPRTVLGPMAHAVGNTIYEHSTNIAAAWQVVMKMIAEYGDFIIDYDNGYEGGPWSASVDKLRVAALAKTAPEAICKAALLTKYSPKNTLKEANLSKIVQIIRASVPRDYQISFWYESGRTEMPESEQEHIKELLEEGYTSGQLVYQDGEDTDTGWWDLITKDDDLPFTRGKAFEGG